MRGDVIQSSHRFQGPCSACEDGDTAMKYHNHEPSPRSYIVYDVHDIETLADEYVAELEKKTKLYQTMLRLELSHFTLWLAKREWEKEGGG